MLDLFYYTWYNVLVRLRKTLTPKEKELINMDNTMKEYATLNYMQYDKDYRAVKTGILKVEDLSLLEDLNHQMFLYNDMYSHLRVVFNTEITCFRPASVKGFNDADKITERLERLEKTYEVLKTL